METCVKTSSISAQVDEYFRDALTLEDRDCREILRKRTSERRLHTTTFELLTPQYTISLG